MKKQNLRTNAINAREIIGDSSNIKDETYRKFIDKIYDDQNVK